MDIIYLPFQSLKWKKEKDTASLLTEYKSPDVIRNDYLYRFTGYDKDGLPGKCLQPLQKGKIVFLGIN